MARKRKKVEWRDGDIFVIPLMDKSCVVGHALDLMTPNIVRIAIYNERFSAINEIEAGKVLKGEVLLSLITCSREQLDFDVWKVIGNKPSEIPFYKYPNEKFRIKGWVGAITYDAALVEDFVNAFYGQAFWDDWYDPEFLNELLIDIAKKPNFLLLKNK